MLVKVADKGWRVVQGLLTSSPQDLTSIMFTQHSIVFLQCLQGYSLDLAVLNASRKTWC